MTLKENMQNDSRTTIIRLIGIDGHLIEEGNRYDIVGKYGDKEYISGYSEGYGKVDIWVF